MPDPIQSCDPRKSEWDPNHDFETQSCQAPKPAKPAGEAARPAGPLQSADPRKSELGKNELLAGYARRHPRPLLPAPPREPLSKAPEWKEPMGQKWQEGPVQRERDVVRYRTGTQNEVELVSERATLESKDGKLKLQVDAPNAKAGFGIHNPDGSLGAGFGVGANAAGVELSAQHSGFSASVGASEGIGFAASSGFRDADGDGNVELCNRIELFWFSGGYCVEVPATLPLQKEILPPPTQK